MNTYNYLLVREETTDHAVPGTLYLNGHRICDTLEPALCCLRAGTYRLTIEDSCKNSKTRFIRVLTPWQEKILAGGPEPQEKNVCTDNEPKGATDSACIQPVVSELPQSAYNRNPEAEASSLSAQTENSFVPTSQKIAAAPMRLHKMEPAVAMDDEELEMQIKDEKTYCQKCADREHEKRLCYRNFYYNLGMAVDEGLSQEELDKQEQELLAIRNRVLKELGTPLPCPKITHGSGAIGLPGGTILLGELPEKIELGDKKIQLPILRNSGEHYRLFLDRISKTLKRGDVATLTIRG